ncbi:hypothetical protein FRAHR75_350075 [Frankia sp. Hr75.2]|nr:hypothetical protein FRAHR75_350075 [Frankia sp. Hr75.2]
MELIAPWGSPERRCGVARYVYRRSLWWTFWKMCAAVGALYLVLAAIEWAFETAPYVVIGGLVVGVLVLVGRVTR